MRSRFRNDPYQQCNDKDGNQVILNPIFQVKKFKAHMNNQECTKRP